MMDLRAYLIRLTAASILAALLRRAAPEGGPGRVTRMGAGLLILLTAFGPLARVDTVSAAEDLARRAFSDPLSAEDFAVQTNELLADLISQEAETYILDKAREMGLGLTATVQTAVGADGYPLPWHVTIQGAAEPWQRAALTARIAEDLGVPEERQEWWDM